MLQNVAGKFCENDVFVRSVIFRCSGRWSLVKGCHCCPAYSGFSHRTQSPSTYYDSNRRGGPRPAGNLLHL